MYIFCLCDIDDCFFCIYVSFFEYLYLMLYDVEWVRDVLRE